MIQIEVNFFSVLYNMVQFDESTTLNLNMSDDQTTVGSPTPKTNPRKLSDTFGQVGQREGNNVATEGLLWL